MYLAPCQTLAAQGRAYPVEIQYAATPAYVDKRPVWEQAAAAFGDYAREGGEGDVLIFMPGSFEKTSAMPTANVTAPPTRPASFSFVPFSKAARFLGVRSQWYCAAACWISAGCLVGATLIAK